MSGALVPSGASGSNFAQQGSVDWVSLSTSTLNFSVEVLSRFSKAGVEMITVAIGQALFSEFNVPPEGQQRVADAVAKLKAFSSYGNVLWFGFGVKHIVRTLCETEQGATCAAICACLSVSYDSFFASKVLKALTDESMTPATLTPALSQWGALINVCSGTVGDSQFPILVEGFSRLIGQNSSAPFRRPLHTPTTAKALAGALRELSKVSNGTLRSVTFEGGIDCGWLAAVAQWLLSLRVEIMDGSGTCLYSNFLGDNLYAQVIIIRHDTVLSETLQAKTVSRSYFVPPGRLCFGLLDQTVLQDVPSTHLYSVGQSEWDSILGNTFGEAANRLFRTGIKLAEFLCSGLRHIPLRQTMDLLNPWGEAYLENDYQRRRGFLSFSARRLPELMSIWEVAEENPERVYGYKSPSPARDFSKVLAEICSCSKCTFGRPAQETSFCLHRVGATLFRFLWILSWLDIDPSIKPSNTGLLTIYYTSKYGDEDPDRLIGSMWQRGLSTRLTSLFTGSTVAENAPAGASAICVGGICIFNAALKDPTKAPSQVVRQRVVLGHIERSGFLYRQVSDGVRDQEAHLDFDALLAAPYTFGPCVNLQLVIEETINSSVLEATFVIETEVVTNHFLDPFVHKHIYKSYNYTRPRQWSFGPTTLRKKIMDHVCMASCVARQVSITSSKRVDEPTVPWTGKCLQAMSALWTDHYGTLECCPRQGEWVLRQELECCVFLLRGSYALLYSILDQMSKTRTISLTYISACVICSTLNRLPVVDGQAVVVDGPQPVTICSMLETSSFQLELVSSMNWSESVHGLCTGATTAESRTFSFEKSRSYTLAKKNVLKQILEQRGILFKKRATKMDMIKMLQDYDAKNSDSANEEVLLIGEDDDGLEVSMEDYS